MEKGRGRGRGRGRACAHVHLALAENGEEMCRRTRKNVRQLGRGSKVNSASGLWRVPSIQITITHLIGTHNTGGEDDHTGPQKGVGRGARSSDPCSRWQLMSG